MRRTAIAQCLPLLMEKRERRLQKLNKKVPNFAFAASGLRINIHTTALQAIILAIPRE